MNNIKKITKTLFWLALCLTMFILCDACKITPLSRGEGQGVTVATAEAKKYKVGQTIVLRGKDTVKVIQVTKTTVKVRYTRKNGTHYEYTVPKNN